jgi:hypothetical protein
MIGGSALAGFIGAKIGGQKKPKPGEPVQPAPATTPESATADVPAPPPPATQQQSTAVAAAQQTAQRTRRRAAVGNAGRQVARGTRRGAAQAIPSAPTPALMLIGGNT